jgi:tRNA nucleotidyltransferase/poly(A) polymerase
MRLQQYINEDREQLKQWQQYVKSNAMLSAAVKVLQNINKKGYKAYIVGGSVRDLILGQDAHDIDIATNMPISDIESLYKTYDIGKSKDFGIVVVKEGSYSFEVAQFRNDGKYLDGRRPESVTVVGSFEEDAARRDFRFNAMAINAKGEIIDYFDGRKDIKNKVLRTVGNPYERFGEDALRIMRAARFASKLGFSIDKDTGKAMKSMSYDITKLSPERIRDELLKSASQSGDKFAKYIELLDKYGILKHILPELVNLKAYKEDLTHHPETRGKGGTVWAHTLEALKASNTKDPLMNLCILLHDIGKGVTFSDTEPGKTYTYYGHDKEGVKLVQEIAKRLKMSNNERDTLMFTVAKHMQFHKMKEMKPSKIFKIVSDDNWEALVAVARADEFSRGEKFMSKKDFEESLKVAIKIKDKWGKKELDKRMKLVSGDHVMQLLGIGPSKKVGEVIKKTTEFILDNNISDQIEIDDYIRSNWG